MRRSTRTAAFAAAVVALGSASSFAEHANVTLRYAGPAAPTACPDEATFRGLVSARLGYDPFTGTGTRALAVQFERRNNEVTGHLTLEARDDGKRTERTLRAPSEECFELATSLALVAAVAVDPDAIEARAAPPSAPSPQSPPPAAPPPPPARVEAAPAAPPAPAPRSDFGVRLELAGVLPVGVVPSPHGGLRAGAGLDFGTWSLHLEGQYLFESSRENEAGAGEVSTSVLSGALLPCVDPLGAATWGLDLCAVGSLGAWRSAASGVTLAKASNELYATVGPRVGVFALFSSAVAVGASADVPVALSRVHLYIEEDGRKQEVWAASPVGFIGAVSLLAWLK